MLPHSYQKCETACWPQKDDLHGAFYQRMSSDIQKLFPCQVVDFTQCETLLFLWTSHGLPVPASHTGSSSHSHLVQSTTKAEISVLAENAKQLSASLEVQSIQQEAIVAHHVTLQPAGLQGSGGLGIHWK
jgi:hypothetical protein